MEDICEKRASFAGALRDRSGDKGKGAICEQSMRPGLHTDAGLPSPTLLAPANRASARVPAQIARHQPD